ncbi:hypothetical protein A2U01_0052553, partial [Trifolium medium]|nr:hypothetical protein [Trifolium medium]
GAGAVLMVLVAVWCLIGGEMGGGGGWR